MLFIMNKAVDISKIHIEGTGLELKYFFKMSSCCGMT
jgi:hypothetical protein